MTEPSRPRWHFTVPAGWINDPYGLTWRDGGYQLFFQYHPGAPRWSPRMSWGQASSPDLVRWSAPRLALAPDGADAGCWSGTLVMDGERPVLLYTRVDTDHPDLGSISRARGTPAFDGWIADEEPPLRPPQGLGVIHFRDPFVWREADRWHLLVGAGLDPPAGAVLGYSSADLRNWLFGGVVCSRPAEDMEGSWTGSVWECPQLFELDGAWVLIVSVAHAGSTRHVSYAVGDWDGATFAPHRWHRLLYGDMLYATTTFLDAVGRRCALSWCREDTAVGDTAVGDTAVGDTSVGDTAGERRAWAGALSTPLVLHRDGDRVLGGVHPDVDQLRRSPTISLRQTRVGPEPMWCGRLGAQSDMVLMATLPPGGSLDLALRSGVRVGLTVTVTGETAVLHRPGRSAVVLPLDASTAGQVELRLLRDADLVEVFTAGGTAGVRLAVATALEVYLTAQGGQVRVDELTGYPMTPVAGS